MTDGVRLASTLFLPDDRPAPWPVVMEANPYRKDDLTQSYWTEYRRFRDEGGYAVCRVDLRGTGSSEGLAVNEYTEQEQDDLCEVVAWLASRGWSSGAVGMYGYSYSGFNSIQVAMRRPPALKAIVPIYATDDRYTDDVHYYGGTRRALDFVDYPTYMVAMNALPPWPAIAGHGWRARWQERVELLQPWVLRWVEEQLDGPYWRHASLRPGYERIVCPVMIVAGWADGYRNNSFRTFERLPGPKRLVIGPWSHASTSTSLPGPHVDLVPEMIRWWDRWLRDDRSTGLDEEPPIAIFVRRSTEPRPDLAEVRGEWRYEERWPPERVRTGVWSLEEADGPALGESEEAELRVRGDVGVTAMMWCSGHLPFGQPEDQRPDEVHSLVFDWPVGGDPLEILGHPAAEVEVRSSAPVASLSAKLCDVFPDGTSALVSRGFLNLTHRDSHREPSALEPGRAYTVGLELDATSWTFEPGHRIRLDLTGSDWPNLWPVPGPATLSVLARGSRLMLPVAPAPPLEGRRPELPPPRAEEPARGGADVELPVVWREERDILGRETRVVIDHGSENVPETGVRTSERYQGSVGSSRDPGRAWAEGHVTFTLEWPEATATSEVRTRLESDAKAWHLTIQLDVSENGEPRWSRRWDRRFPRNLA